MLLILQNYVETLTPRPKNDG